MTVLAFLSNLVSFSAIFLFIVIMRTISLFCTKLSQDIRHCQTPNQQIIFEWKRTFRLIVSSIKLINKTFGVFLLLAVTHSFIFLLTHVFYLVNRASVIKEMDILFTAFQIIFYFILLLTVVHAPTKLDQKVLCEFFEYKYLNLFFSFFSISYSNFVQVHNIAYFLKSIINCGIQQQNQV